MDVFQLFQWAASDLTEGDATPRLIYPARETISRAPEPTAPRKYVRTARDRYRVITLADDADVFALVRATTQSSATPIPGRGVDLVGRFVEVQKLFYAGYGAQAKREGMDPEEILQEVYCKILVANAGKNPFNPAKSSFGHYVHMVCRGAFFNYRAKVFRHRAREQMGMPVFSEDSYREDDAGGSLHDHGEGQLRMEAGVLHHNLQDRLEEPRVVQMALEGYSVKEISQRLNLSTPRVKNTLQESRDRLGNRHSNS